MYNIIFLIENDDGEKEHLINDILPDDKKSKILEKALSTFYQEKVKVIATK